MIQKRVGKAVVTAVLLASATLASAPSYAGLVWFSRANCINNESISWDWPGRNHMLLTNSFHWNSKSGWQEPVRTGWQWGYRSGAVHWFEGMSGGWYVIGHHFRWIQPYGEHFMGYTPTTNCKLEYFFPYW